MAVSRTLLLAAFILLAIPRSDAWRWSRVAPAQTRSRVARSRRPARHESRDGEFVHAISCRSGPHGLAIARV